MARPKSGEYEASALGRIERAFWLLLERIGFSNMTMKLLAQQAEINRNTLYYHYANLQEIASAAFQNVINDEISSTFLDFLLAPPADIGSVWSEMQLSARIYKIHLYAKSDSPLLRAMLKESILQRWFQKLGIQEEFLSSGDLLQLDYIVNGLIGIMGNPAVITTPPLLVSFTQSPIGQAAIQTMLLLSKQQRDSST